MNARQVVGVDVDRQVEDGLADQGDPQQRVGLGLVDRDHERVVLAGDQRDVQVAGAGVVAEPEVPSSWTSGRW